MQHEFIIKSFTSTKKGTKNNSVPFLVSIYILDSAYINTSINAHISIHSRYLTETVNHECKVYRFLLLYFFIDIKDIAFYTQEIAACKRQGELYTPEEARRERKRFNDINNEGGDGFVPVFYTHEQYEYYTEKLVDLKKQLLEYSE